MIWHLLSTNIHFARDSSCGTNNGFFPGLYDKLCVGGNVQIQGVDDILVMLTNIIRILTAVAGGIAVIALIVGGIFYVISGGEPAKIKRAKDIIIDSVIGLMLIITAYAIVTFIGNSF